jgi:AAA+ superfamily predicted ATPase
MPGYPDGGSHLQEALERVDQLVRAEFERFRAGLGAVKPAEEWGVPGVAGAEVSAYLDGAFSLPYPVVADTVGPRPVPDAVMVHEAAAQSIAALAAARLAATPEPPRLERLRRAFGLRPAEVDALLVALLPELAPEYRRLYAVLMDDATRTHPTADLVCRVLRRQLPDAAAVHALFTGRAVSAGLLLLDAGAGPFPSHGVQVDPRITAYLLGSDDPDPRLAGLVSGLPPGPGWAGLVLADDVAERARALGHYCQGAAGPRLILLHGRYGSGRRSVAAALAAGAGLPVLTAAAPASAGVLDLVYREATLRGAAVCWTGAEALIEAEDPAWTGLVAAAAAYPGLTLVTSELPWEPAGDARDVGFASLTLPAPGFLERRQLWIRTLAGLAMSTVDAAGSTVDGQAGGERDRLAGMLANAFQFTGGQLADAVASARSLAVQRDPAAPAITAADLFEGARRQSSRRLVAFARRIEPRAGLSFADLVLPRPSRRQLDELRGRIAYSHRIYDEFGFERRITLGRGVVAMFTGASGTGKTMAAELLAREQGADLYKVDLAAVVSKYVGETEKNLDRVFADAERANAMIFFDEADALFAKRGEVREAKDRWANVELAFLLQRIEEHRGVVILASNLRQNIDEAFLRRLHSIVDFPNPDATARLRIWIGMFPANLDYPPEDSIAELAERFALPGGSIRNVVLDAAFRSLGRDERARGVTLRDLAVSVGREYAKLRLPITPGEFGPDFYRWVEDDLLTDDAVEAR